MNDRIRRQLIDEMDVASRFVNGHVCDFRFQGWQSRALQRLRELGFDFVKRPAGKRKARK